MGDTKKHRNQLVDFIKISLALMVVAIHLNVFKDNMLIDAYTVDGFFRVAVPFFFVVNGYYLKKTVKEFSSFKLWVRRVIILFFSWQVIYLPMFFPHDEINAQHLVVFVSQVIFGYYHLWYLAAMLMGGVCLYLLKNFKNLLLLCVFLFFVGWFLQYVRVFLSEDGIYFKIMSQYWIFRNGFFYGLPMMYMGYYLAENKIIEKYPASKIIYVFLISIFLLLFEIFISRAVFFTKISYHIDFILSLLIFAPSFFALAMKFESISLDSINTKSIAMLAGAIYFIHPYVIFFISTSGFKSMFVCYVLTVALTLAISSILIFFKRRLGFLL